jgi:uncharacterized protein
MNRNSDLILTRAVRLSTALLVIALFFSADFAVGQQPAKATAGSTALHQAARTGDVASLRSQLQQGTNPDLPDSQGRTALMEAAKAGRAEAVSVLLDAGANVNAHSRSGNTALIDAAEAGQADVARLLVQHGADVNAATRAGSALAIAERNGDNELAALLRQAGARSTGHSVGDTVCVRPWSGDGYCGVVEARDKNNYRLRVTQIIGCKDGCSAKAECSEEKPVGGANGISVGTEVNTKSWCLTQTGVR